MLTLVTALLADGEEATERYGALKGKTARQPQYAKGAGDVMTHAATWLRLVSLLSGGKPYSTFAAQWKRAGASAEPSTLMGATYMCQHVAGLLHCCDTIATSATESSNSRLCQPCGVPNATLAFTSIRRALPPRAHCFFHTGNCPAFGVVYLRSGGPRNVSVRIVRICNRLVMDL